MNARQPLVPKQLALPLNPCYELRRTLSFSCIQGRRSRERRPERKRANMIEESYCVTMSGRGGLPCRAKRRLAFTLAGWRRASAGGLIAGLLISGWGLSVYGQEIAYTHGRQTDPGMGLEG